VASEKGEGQGEKKVDSQLHFQEESTTKPEEGEKNQSLHIFQGKCLRMMT